MCVCVYVYIGLLIYFSFCNFFFIQMNSIKKICNTAGLIKIKVEALLICFSFNYKLYTYLDRLHELNCKNGFQEDWCSFHLVSFPLPICET